MLLFLVLVNVVPVIYSLRSFLVGFVFLGQFLFFLFETLTLYAVFHALSRCYVYFGVSLRFLVDLSMPFSPFNFSSLPSFYHDFGGTKSLLMGGRM